MFIRKASRVCFVYLVIRAAQHSAWCNSRGSASIEWVHTYGRRMVILIPWNLLSWTMNGPGPSRNGGSRVLGGETESHEVLQ